MSIRFVLLLVALVVVIDADNWFTRRRYQKEASFQRPLSSHFRRRLGGPAGRNPVNYRDYQQRELAPTSAAVVSPTELRESTYAPAYGTE